MNAQERKAFAADIRVKTLESLETYGSGHLGGCMSIADLLAVLYGGEMKIDPQKPDWEDRDYLVLSKGHAGPALYATLALKGFFPLEMLATLNQGGTQLPSHCDRNKTPGVDMTTGSLGQGLSAALGMALGLRLAGKENRVYCIIGDGEAQEGQIWEAAMTAGHYKTDKLTCFVDNNKQQIDGNTKDVADIEDIGAKFSDFGWHVQRIDGHDVNVIAQAIQKAKEEGTRPSCIVLDTEKGKGCCFAEGRHCHHMPVSKAQAEEAIEKIRASR